MSEAAGGPLHRVDFVIGGVQKGGTTFLASILAAHPGIVMPEMKEPHWFDNDERYAHGVPPPARYHALYGDPTSTRLWGDATPTYWWWPPAPARIRDYHPGIRWILLLRDPASRAYSHWNMERKRGRETLGFREALAAEDERMRRATMHESRAYSYLSRGYYARQLARLWTLFPREQTLVLRSDWLYAEPSAIAARVFRFLGVPPMPPSALPPINAGDYDSPLDPADRAALVASYASDIRELETMTGWDLKDWLR
jgi:hypothetical protein